MCFVCFVSLLWTENSKNYYCRLTAQDGSFYEYKIIDIMDTTAVPDMDGIIGNIIIEYSTSNARPYARW